jgi:hypothetical protein
MDKQDFFLYYVNIKHYGNYDYLFRYNKRRAWVDEVTG